ncbi:MAG: GNAT family N-acetyltransferase [FCB group bacterium]|nr:GNAT family N-acetyltransferase [FCB group bacterium]
MPGSANLSRPRILESERLFITPPTLDDLETNFRWDNDHQLSLLDGGRFQPRTRDEVREKLVKKMASTSFLHFSIILKSSGKHIGNAVVFEISDHDRRCRWGIRLGPEYNRQGYGSETARLIFHYVFENLNMRRLVSGANGRNTVSMQFHDSLGFVLEGRLRDHRLIEGETFDELVYGLMREDYERLYK